MRCLLGGVGSHNYRCDDKQSCLIAENHRTHPTSGPTGCATGPVQSQLSTAADRHRVSAGTALIPGAPARSAPGHRGNGWDRYRVRPTCSGRLAPDVAWWACQSSSRPPRCSISLAPLVHGAGIDPTEPHLPTPFGRCRYFGCWECCPRDLRRISHGSSATGQRQHLLRVRTGASIHAGSTSS
jgi:hypothetical protein